MPIRSPTDLNQPAAGIGFQLLRQKEAAVVLGVSVAWLRASTCPKVLLPGNGPKGQAIVRYDTADLDAWKETHKTKRKAG